MYVCIYVREAKNKKNQERRDAGKKKKRRKSEIQEKRNCENEIK
jgi:hypothetical protein